VISHRTNHRLTESEMRTSRTIIVYKIFKMVISQFQKNRCRLLLLFLLQEPGETAFLLSFSYGFRVFTRTYMPGGALF
jgi:hypothetical protein